MMELGFEDGVCWWICRCTNNTWDTIYPSSGPRLKTLRIDYLFLIDDDDYNVLAMDMVFSNDYNVPAMDMVFFLNCLSLSLVFLPPRGSLQAFIKEARSQDSGSVTC